MKMQSDPLNHEPQERKEWAEPVTAVLMALTTLSTATGVLFVVVSRLFGDRFKPKTS